MTPSVSIIIPVYNGARYLPDTVASVLSQSRSDWELIIVDDGSDDGWTPALCDSYAADRRVRVFHKPNGGISDARNYAIPLARAPYLSFLDADDLLHPDFIRLTLHAAEESGADIVFTIPDFFTGKFDMRPVRSHPRVCTIDPVEAVRTALFQTGLDNGVWAKLYRTTLWSDLRFHKGRRYEDLDIFYRPVLAAAKVAFLPMKLYGYRQHSDSYIHVFTPQRADVLDVTDEMLEWMRRNRPELVSAAADRRMSAHFNILLLLYANHVENPQLEQRCLEVIRSQRRASLTGRGTRLKNRIGALVAYVFPRFTLRILSRMPFLC